MRVWAGDDRIICIYMGLCLACPLNKQAAKTKQEMYDKSRQPTSSGPRSQTGDPTNLDRQQGIHTVLGGYTKVPTNRDGPF